MFKFLKKLWRDRRGNALVIAGASLPLVIGSAGLASDTVQWAMMKRQLQRAADSAALAGVYGELASQTVSTGACSASAPISRDMTNSNIANRVGTTPTCAVVTQPTGAWSAASYEAVQVTMSATRPMAFSGLFLSTAPTISASSTAALVQTGQYCVISLDNNVETGLNFSGSATVNLGCGMKANAKGSSAVNGTGSSAITGSPVAAVGQIANGGNFATGTIFQPYSPPQADPFASVNAPASTAYPSASCPSFSVGSNKTQHGINSGSDYKPMTGLSNYYCMSSFNVQGTVTLPSGVYVIDGGNFSIGSQANVSCSGCAFVLTNRSTSTTATIGTVGMNGGATVNLTDSTTGTYANILFYQDRRAQLATGAGQSSQINGNSSSSFQGAFYFPSTQMIFNGTSGMTTHCVQMVAWQVTFIGNTTINNVCPGSGPPAGFNATVVRLVA